MINEETRRKLREMCLEDLIHVLDMQDGDPAFVGMPFDERIQMAVDYTWQEKYNDRVKRMLRQAHFRFPTAEVRSIYYPERGLDRTLIAELSTCQFVCMNMNIVVYGFTGAGKSYLACALGKQACRQKIRSRYIRVPDLLTLRDEAAAERNGISKLLKKFGAYTVLILDEWLMDEYSGDELHFLFELFERRYETASTILCTQYKVEDWHARLGGGVLADSIMDRIIHKTYWLYSGDLNMRELQSRRDLAQI